MARYEDASVKAYVSLAVLNAGQAVIFTIGLCGAMVLCAYGIEHGTNTVGDFVMINAMMIQLYTPLNFMGMVYREIKQAVIDIENMFSLLSRQPEIEDRPGAPPLQVRAGTIRFENVSFAYEPARPILKGLSFDVAAGHTVAIVGPSGAGKSTISRLLFRFYEVSGGRILIDGQDIRDVTQASLRAAIGMVPQDTVLFNDTIRYNIRYGRWDASDAEVEEAARQAQIDGFIRARAEGLRDRSRRTRLKTVRRREAARRHRAHHPQSAADPAARRSDLGARQPYREGHPGRARPGRRRTAPRSSSRTGCRPSSAPTRFWCSITARSSSAARTANCWRMAGSMPACGTGSAKRRWRARFWRRWTTKRMPPIAIRRRWRMSRRRNFSLPPTPRNDGHC